jgi:hypothetical protein
MSNNMPLIDLDYANKLLDNQVNPASPTDWISKTLGVELWSKQREILKALETHKNVAVKSGHGVGKSFTAAVVATWWAATHPPDETMVVTTAPSKHQVSTILWEDIRKLHRKGQLPGEIQRSDRWLVGDTVIGFGRKPQDYDKHAFQGLHRKYVLVIIDEACGIDEWLWIAALAITTGVHCKILAIGNPDDPSSYFAKVCSPTSDWFKIKISVLDSPNFTGEKVSQHMKDQLTDQTYLDAMAAEVGRDSPLWTSKVLGEFPEIDEFSVIPLGWIFAAQERWKHWNEYNEGVPDRLERHVIGADIARFGKDKTVFAHRYGDVITSLEVQPKVDTYQTANLLMKKMSRNTDLAVIDTNGVGAGVFDVMRKQGYHCLGFNAGSRTQLKDSSGQVEFYNLRAAVYWKLRELLDPARNSTICLPPDDKLASELSAARWGNAAGGKILIESKDDIRKRVGGSPDRGDAVALAFWASRMSVTGNPADSAFNWREPRDFEDDVALPWDESLDSWDAIPLG